MKYNTSPLSNFYLAKKLRIFSKDQHFSVKHKIMFNNKVVTIFSFN